MITSEERELKLVKRVPEKSSRKNTTFPENNADSVSEFFPFFSVEHPFHFYGSGMWKLT